MHFLQETHDITAELDHKFLLTLLECGVTWMNEAGTFQNTVNSFLNSFFLNKSLTFCKPRHFSLSLIGFIGLKRSKSEPKIYFCWYSTGVFLLFSERKLYKELLFISCQSALVTHFLDDQVDPVTRFWVIRLILSPKMGDKIYLVTQKDE